MNSIIKPLFDAGIQALLKSDKDNESGKSGVLRGGNSGIYIPQQNLVVGKCARLSYLRYKGITVEETTESRKLMFTAGVSNEDQWYDALSKSYPTELILREEQIPVNWRTDNNVEVTGRPDFVLLDSEGKKPKVGIELKLVSSIWTARDVLFEGRPKFDHLIQAAHYMWKLDIPFELWYTSRADFATNEMVNRCLPNYGTHRWKLLEQHMKIGYYKKVVSKAGNTYGKSVKKEEFEHYVNQGQYGFKEGEYYAAPIAIYPFAVGYTLWWGDDGRLNYKSTETGDQLATIITKDNIENYYNLVAYMDTTDELPERPTELKGDGTKANFNKCDYCPLAATCDSSEKKKHGVKDWLKLVKSDLKDKKND
jgi:hypothetical protein